MSKFPNWMLRMWIRLRRGNIHWTNMHGVDLSGLNLAGVMMARADLREADLGEADLTGTNLTRANLTEANLRKANLERASLAQANLEGADLTGAILNGANLDGAILERANLYMAKLSGADLQRASLLCANLQSVNLQGANLARARLGRAAITGAYLYGTARDNWNIDNISCDFVFWEERTGFFPSEGRDWEQEHRMPKDRDFRPGEFEELYKSLPTFEYIFEQGFTPLDPLIMDRVVQAINERQPEIELKLDSFHSRGQAHAVFTVLHKGDTEEALKAVKAGYEAKIEALKEQKEEFRQLLQKAIERPQIVERIINAGRDYIEHIEGDAHVMTSEPSPFN